MIPYSVKLETLRQSAIDYIKGRMDSKTNFVFEDFGEVLKTQDGYKYRSQRSKQHDIALWKTIDSLSTEDIMAIADFVQYSPVKSFK